MNRKHLFESKYALPNVPLADVTRVNLSDDFRARILMEASLIELASPEELGRMVALVSSTFTDPANAAITAQGRFLVVRTAPWQLQCESLRQSYVIGVYGPCDADDPSLYIVKSFRCLKQPPPEESSQSDWS